MLAQWTVVRSVASRKVESVLGELADLFGDAHVASGGAGEARPARRQPNPHSPHRLGRRTLPDRCPRRPEPERTAECWLRFAAPMPNNVGAGRAQHIRPNPNPASVVHPTEPRTAARPRPPSLRYRTGRVVRRNAARRLVWPVGPNWPRRRSARDRMPHPRCWLPVLGRSEQHSCRQARGPGDYE